MNHPPLVSIIINNYNYGRFLPQAIESALGQTYRPIEVIVVDDGSTDDSRAHIAAYGERVLPVLKANGGQASAFNAGLERSQGEVIIFLDADDMLCPGTAERVAEVFVQDPGAVKVNYRLEVVNRDGQPTGQVRPAWQKPLPHGDLTRQVLSFPDDIAWQPTSGNAFAARVLHQIFPVPEAVYPICADYYLSNLPPLFGRVHALDEVGGYYRVHSANNHHTSQLNLAQVRQIITRTCHTHRFLKLTADRLGLVGFPAEPLAVPSVSFAANRIVSLRLEPQHHPVAADRLPALCLLGVRAAWGRFDLPLGRRLLCAAWFVLVSLAPRRAVRWLANRFFY